MLRRSIALVVGLLAVVVLLGVVGCSSGAGSLDGSRWRLKSWTLDSLNPADFTITAEFADGRISGSSGVNTYGGPVKVGPGSAFSAGPLASTMMAGPEPAMRAESAYVTLLGQAKSFKVVSGTLTLYDANGNESLVFGAVDK